MSPPIEASITRLESGRWLMGSLLVCDVARDAIPTDPLASWKSDDGIIYYIRNRVHGDEIDVNSYSEIAHSDLVHFMGSSASVWAFGDVHIKVKSWIPTLQLESESIQYVVDNTSIPVPQVVYAWIDHEWNRTFLIMKTVKGTTLANAWHKLSPKQKTLVADQVATYCEELSCKTSDRIETLSGKGPWDDWLFGSKPWSQPSWIPHPVGPLTTEQNKAFVGLEDVKIGKEFLLYHADLGPTNIMVDQGGTVVAIIDWKSLAYYPSFWLATKPLFSAGFNLTGSERNAWALSLSDALQKRGFKAEVDMYRRWRAAVKAKTMTDQSWTISRHRQSPNATETMAVRSSLLSPAVGQIR